MTLFSIFPRVTAPGPGELSDTLYRCRTMGKTYRYVHGGLPPHYPVPAIPTKTFIFDDQVFVVLNRSDYRCIKLWWKGEGEI